MNSANASDRPIRVLVAKAGLDGHDRGAKVVAACLRDAGMEVIYTGLRNTPEMIVAAAIQEDVDAIGLSSLSGAHNTLFPRVLELLRQRGAESILVFGGGVIPEAEAKNLNDLGVGRLFGPGTDTNEIVNYLRQEIPKRRTTSEV
ncbi:MAG: cobalamin B12-binding domain-containing protein [Planctomycetes bacterium]|jgi:methylmalonyl-CoA mutase C-terminal domain/subunit|nr:cobalamin B12-binding domain-containing protein [Planctomycetota bacterium]